MMNIASEVIREFDAHDENVKHRIWTLTPPGLFGARLLVDENFESLSAEYLAREFNASPASIYRCYNDQNGVGGPKKFLAQEGFHELVKRLKYRKDLITARAARLSIDETLRYDQKLDAWAENYRELGNPSFSDYMRFRDTILSRVVSEENGRNASDRFREIQLVTIADSLQVLSLGLRGRSLGDDSRQNAITLGTLSAYENVSLFDPDFDFSPEVIVKAIKA